MRRAAPRIGQPGKAPAMPNVPLFAPLSEWDRKILDTLPTIA